MTENAQKKHKNSVGKECISVLKLINDACSEIKVFLEDENREMEKGRLEELRKNIEDALLEIESDAELETGLAEFNSLCKKYSEKIHFLYQSRDLARWEHYTRKLDLCTEVEKLLKCSDRDLPKVARELKLIRLRWKDIGSVPHEKSEEIWNKFCELSDKLQSRITEYYNELEEKRAAIAVEKIKICEKAEEIQQQTEWEETAQAFKNLQKLWRDVGFTAPDQEKELYMRFRAACDIFFNARKEYYQTIKKEREEINSIKFQLCEEAKTIFELSYSRAHQLIPDLWKRWKEAGSSGKNDRELYERFRGYFDKYYEGLRKQRNENMEAKKELCDEIETILSDVKSGKKILPDIEAKYYQIKAKWEQVGAMPRADEKPVLDRFFKLTKQLDSIVAGPECWNKEVITRSFEIEKVVSKALEALDARKIDEFDKCQEIWSALNCSEKKFFRDCFDEITVAFEDGSSEHGKKLLELSNDNLRKRVEICSELECIGKGAKKEMDNEDLAAELKEAIVNNFGSGAADKTENINDKKINNLIKNWITSGPVPLNELEQVYERFGQAVDSVQISDK
jgi:chemotaxis protein histidine kinase CheA